MIPVKILICSEEITLYPILQVCRIANSDLTVSISYNIFNPKSSDKLKSEETE